MELKKEYLVYLFSFLRILLSGIVMLVVSIRIGPAYKKLLYFFSATLFGISLLLYFDYKSKIVCYFLILGVYSLDFIAVFVLLIIQSTLSEFLLLKWEWLIILFDFLGILLLLDIKLKLWEKLIEKRHLSKTHLTSEHTEE